ncbi:41819_t:CDS:2, partial [Gigaspora margarita]
GPPNNTIIEPESKHRISWNQSPCQMSARVVETISKSGIFGAQPPLGGTYGPISISLKEPPPGWNETHVDSISGGQKIHTSSSTCDINNLQEKVEVDN